MSFRLNDLWREILLLCFLCFGPIQSTSAEEKAKATNSSFESFGTVLRISGTVTASGRALTQSRELHQGDTVFVGELLKSSSSGEAVLNTADKGMIAIRPNTVFLAEFYSAEGQSTDGYTIRLLTGSLRVISGWISHINRSNARIVTPSATIGIRGTDHEPYVLSAKLAAATSSGEGTYDKVNSGGTTMIVRDKSLDIDPGKVGFVKANNNLIGGLLMTVLLPELLDKVPNFYVPGQFDAELDQYSPTADKASQLELERKRKTASPPPYVKCNPREVADKWLSQLDAAIAKRDALTIVSLFAPDASIHATVRDGGGKMTTLNFDRDEFSLSTVMSMKNLKYYKQRRVSAKVETDNPASNSCNRVLIKSVVIEQGIQSGKHFRFESLEEYVLQLRDDKWISIYAETTQQ